MHFPKVTVVTVCYNAREDLKRTVESTLSLDYSNIEYIIIDGGSSDKTIDYLQKQPKNIKWLSEPDDGIYYAMNKGVSMACGEWVIFMNAGDVFHAKDTISKVMQHSSSEYDFLYGDRIRVETNGESSLQKAGDLADYLKTEVVYHQALFNRTARLKKRPYNTNYALAADYEYVVEAISNGAMFRHVSLPVCNFQCGGRSRTEHVRGMTEAIKISIDFQSNKDQWTQSDFFRNYIGNHLETTLNEVVDLYLGDGQSSGGNIFSDSKGLLRVRLNKHDETFHRYLNRVLRPLSKLALRSGNNIETKINQSSFRPKVSIVTVVYNDLNGMKKTFENVKALSYSNIEYLVIDGASTDGTGDFIRSNVNHIDVLVSESDRSIYDAMNKAIDKAAGDYIIFMNAGDTFTASDVLEKIFDNADISCDVIYGDRNYLADENSTHQMAKDITTVFERMPYCHQSALVKLSVIRKFKFDETYKFAADYNQVVLMYLNQVKFKKVNIIVSDFLAGGRSESGIRPYLEVVKIQLDNAPKDFDASKSAYIRGLKNNFPDLIGDI